jgi:hypothetical protein
MGRGICQFDCDSRCFLIDPIDDVSRDRLIADMGFD